MKAWQVIGYTYKADTYCPSDTVSMAYTDNGHRLGVSALGAEHNLDVLAQELGIDRYAEETFDSGDFPKVIFASQVTDETCGKCHDPLSEG